MHDLNRPVDREGSRQADPPPGCDSADARPRGRHYALDVDTCPRSRQRRLPLIRTAMSRPRRRRPTLPPTAPSISGMAAAHTMSPMAPQIKIKIKKLISVFFCSDRVNTSLELKLP
eukprot:PhM_4_TR17416/c4_g2_i1/m.82320